MYLNRKLRAFACVSAIALSSGSASAAVIDFTNFGDGAGSGVSLSCAAFGIANYGGCSVTYNNAGLGVNGRPDSAPDQVDGNPLFSSERITLSFAQDMVWNNITFGRWDSNDDARLSADGASVQYTGNGSSVDLGGYVSSYLTIAAYGDVRNDCSSFFSCLRLRGNDSFTIASVDVSAVPVPASLPLVLGGLGMLGWASRKRKKAA